MGSDNAYRARPSRAKAALMRDKIQLQLDRYSWLGRFLCPSDWILVTSTDSSNVDRFPTLNAGLLRSCFPSLVDVERMRLAFDGKLSWFQPKAS
ncbi:MAG: hypothetical protein LC775_03085 [Acidobacteria bacterium]|nr:hypothetical protein [Acidobacteriota bacterium]